MERQGVEPYADFLARKIRAPAPAPLKLIRAPAPAPLKLTPDILPLLLTPCPDVSGFGEDERVERSSSGTWGDRPDLNRRELEPQSSA